MDNLTTNTTTNTANGHAIVLFDGVCNFCNHSVKFIVQRDRSGYFRFASLQSEVAESLFSAYRIPPSGSNSIVLIEGGVVFTESAAILRICKQLDGGWKGLYVFIVIPRTIRDALYRWFAKRRYRFFGKRESCMIPTADMRRRFLENDEKRREER